MFSISSCSWHLLPGSTRLCVKSKHHWSIFLVAMRCFSFYAISFYDQTSRWCPWPKKFDFVSIWTQHTMPVAVLKTREVQMLCFARCSHETSSRNAFKQLVVKKRTFNRWLWNTTATTKVCNSKTEIFGPSSQRGQGSRLDTFIQKNLFYMARMVLYFLMAYTGYIGLHYLIRNFNIHRLCWKRVRDDGDFTCVYMSSTSYL